MSDFIAHATTCELEHLVRQVPAKSYVQILQVSPASVIDDTARQVLSMHPEVGGVDCSEDCLVIATSSEKAHDEVQALVKRAVRRGALAYAAVSNSPEWLTMSEAYASSVTVVSDVMAVPKGCKAGFLSHDMITSLDNRIGPAHGKMLQAESERNKVTYAAERYTFDDFQREWTEFIDDNYAFDEEDERKEVLGMVFGLLKEGFRSIELDLDMIASKLEAFAARQAFSEGRDALDSSYLNEEGPSEIGQLIVDLGLKVNRGFSPACEDALHRILIDSSLHMRRSNQFTGGREVSVAPELCPNPHSFPGFKGSSVPNASAKALFDRTTTTRRDDKSMDIMYQGALGTMLMKHCRATQATTASVRIGKALEQYAASIANNLPQHFNIKAIGKVIEDAGNPSLFYDEPGIRQIAEEEYSLGG